MVSIRIPIVAMLAAFALSLQACRPGTDASSSKDIAFDAQAPAMCEMLPTVEIDDVLSYQAPAGMDAYQDPGLPADPESASGYALADVPTSPAAIRTEYLRVYGELQALKTQWFATIENRTVAPADVERQRQQIIEKKRQLDMLLAMYRQSCGQPAAVVPMPRDPRPPFGGTCTAKVVQIGNVMTNIETQQQSGNGSRLACRSDTNACTQDYFPSTYRDDSILQRNVKVGDFCPCTCEYVAPAGSSYPAPFP